MVDADRVRRMLELLEHHKVLLADGSGDPYRRRHLIQTAAQICIDLANHAIASQGLRTPRDYGDAFRVLAEVGILPADLADRLVSLAGARNLIVHLYAEVNDELLAQSIRDGGLDDLDGFAHAIAALTVESEDD